MDELPLGDNPYISGGQRGIPGNLGKSDTMEHHIKPSKRTTYMPQVLCDRNYSTPLTGLNTHWINLAVSPGLCPSPGVPAAVHYPVHGITCP